MDKATFLKERGWYQWYNPNYWCHKQFAKTRGDETYWGMGTEEAYAFETDPESREKTLEGMKIFGAIEQAASNLWYNKAKEQTPPQEDKGDD